MEWNRATILHFINLIKQRPAIWDIQSPEYKMKRRRFAAIEEIALLMSVSPKDVNTKWIILRNQYSRERRKIVESDAASPYTTKWYAYKHMDALIGRNKQRPSRNFWTEERQSDGEESSSTPPPKSRPMPLVHQQPQVIDPVAQNSLSFYSQAIKTMKSIREEKNESKNDELTNYGLYIAAHLRKFSPPLQSRAKYEINKILYALDMESMGEFSASIPSIEDHDDMNVSKECKFDPLQNNKE